MCCSLQPNVPFFRMVSKLAKARIPLAKVLRNMVELRSVLIVLFQKIVWIQKTGSPGCRLQPSFYSIRTIAECIPRQAEIVGFAVLSRISAIHCWCIPCTRT
ncbi:hypothetical protein TNCT_576611 [Trichonephila clavata]|uniref:Uncharacterized protein n=1 Tax=Trichonephila clavata TaxID=2740835 RepID=A0A8X6GI54_TRICU|nr:hypothetical protein TNCT_576611 [Trichonephila clavata]